MSHADPSGRLVSELFQKLPSKVVSPRIAFVLSMMPLKLLHVLDTHRPVCPFLALPRLLCHYKGADRSENDRSKNTGTPLDHLLITLLCTNLFKSQSLLKAALICTVFSDWILQNHQCYGEGH